MFYMDKYMEQSLLYCQHSYCLLQYRTNNTKVIKFGMGGYAGKDYML